MVTDNDPGAVRPATLEWVRRHLASDERVIASDKLSGGITAEMKMLTIGGRNGSRRLVLRSYVEPSVGDVEDSADRLSRESTALSLLGATAVSAPELVAVDPTAASCEYPSLLMTHLPGRTVLDDVGAGARVQLLARRLVTIHAVQPIVRPQPYVTLTTANTVMTPSGADTSVWAAAIDLIDRPAPPFRGRFLHRDFQPGNVLFDVRPGSPAAVRISGVVDWAAASWGPADLDVAHCCTNLALLHGPAWGRRFAEAYEQAGGRLAAAADERQYWLVRDALACSEEVDLVAQPWWDAGRTDLTPDAVRRRLDAYVTSLLDPPT